MKPVQTIQRVIISVLIALATPVAFALPTACDVTFGGECADDFGTTGAVNDNTGEIGSLFPPDDWTQLLKTDGSSSGSFMGVDFILGGATPGEPASGGDFTLSWTASPADLLPLYLDLVFTLKAGPAFWAYLFEDEAITDQSGSGAGTGSTDGTWEIAFLNPGGKPPALSHFSVYVREGEEPDKPDPPTEIPVPGTLILLGLGLSALSHSRRKKR